MKSLSSSPEKIFILIGIIYFSTCSIALFTVTPAMDTLYYWDWGRHLALSYFDGPPMVAYVFAAFTYFFGNTIISVNALSILSSFLIIVPIYALAKKMFDIRVAFFSVWIWLLTLFTFQKFTTGFSYDTPVTFFWALTAYFFIADLKTAKTDIFIMPVSARGSCCFPNIPVSYYFFQ